jgi:tol-pal system protein YbgF
MVRVLVLCTLLLSGGGLSCVGEGDLQIFRADIMALERVQHQRERDVIDHLAGLETRVAQPTQEQEALRHGAAQTVATLEELRQEVKRLNETIQNLQRGMLQDADAANAMHAKLGALETRLAVAEHRVAAVESPNDEPRQSQAAASVVMSPPARPGAAPALSATEPSPPVLDALEPEQSAAAPTVLSAGHLANRLYRQALQVYEEGYYDGAVVLFKQFLYQHGQSPLAGDVQYWIGESLYAQRKYEAAVVAFDDVMQKYPEDAKVPAAMFKQALAFAELRDINSARLLLQQLRDKYADSPEANQASEKLKQLRY